MGPMLFEQKQQNIINSGNEVLHQSDNGEYHQKQKRSRKFSLNLIKPKKFAFNKKIDKFINNGTLVAKIYKSPKKCFVTIEKTTSDSYVIDDGDHVMTNIFNGPDNINNRPQWSHVKLSYITKSNKLSCNTFETDKSILYNTCMPLSNSNPVATIKSVGKDKSIFKRFNIKSIFKTSFTSYTTIISDTKTITKCEHLKDASIKQEDNPTTFEIQAPISSTTSLMMFETSDYKSETTSNSLVNLENEIISSDTINSTTNVDYEQTDKFATPRSKRELEYNIPLILTDTTNNYNDYSKNDCYNTTNNISMNCLRDAKSDELFSEEDTYQHQRRRGRLRYRVTNNYNTTNNIKVDKTENSKNKIANNIKTNNSFNYALNNDIKNLKIDNYYNNNNNNNYNNNKNIKNLFIDYYNKTLNLLLLLSSLTPLPSATVTFMKFRSYVTLPTQILSTSPRITSPILWMIGLAIAITILPINLVNASSHSDEQYDLEISYNDNVSYMNGTNTTVVRKTPLFPKDLFTPEQLENGAVVLHILGVIYMFVALAIVCDEFFVPSLDVIIEKLGITDDVAGATFMAAGGSAPELFTSVIGVFVSFDDVGIGTIVGSAVFNILFVIGMCALFSKTVLSLTWWPLFRDCSFYSVSLLILIYFFRDNLIYWWEALVLFFIYIAYVGFMKWNQQVERCVKKVIYKNKVTRVRSTDQLMPAGNAANSSETSMATQPGGSVTSRAASESRSGPPGSSSGATGNSSTNAGSTVTGAKFRHGLLQLMIHTIDPLHDGKVDEKATQLHAIASLKVLLDATKPQRGAATTSAANHVKINLKETTLASDRPNGNIDTTLDSPSVGGRRASWIEQRVKMQARRFSTKGNDLEEEPEALSMSWPSTGRKRITYLLVAPIVFPLWLTLPDTRTPRGKKLFPVTFLGSIVWIAAYSYLMVWWANIAGDTAKIPPEVMGLTFLAAGTSIPDLITSVIVARKGFGDMAVSSSVGSNIFDVTVGLPIPWLLFGIIYQQPVEVNSVGMVCSITILFMMLLFVVLSIACFRWRMNKGLGLTMFLLYFVFVAVSLMFEYKVITCPV